MTDREIFQRNLENLMNITKVKQMDIAKYAEVSYQTVSAWICGRGYPRPESLEKLCRFFNVRQSALTEEQDPEASQEDILLAAFRSLSSEGKQKMIERAEELSRLYPRGKKKKVYGKVKATK